MFDLEYHYFQLCLKRVKRYINSCEKYDLNPEKAPRHIKEKMAFVKSVYDSKTENLVNIN